MLVQRLRLRDFRTYAAADVALGPSLTVVHGPNGAGKTNLLEGLYFGCTSRSCRATTRSAYSRALAQRNALLGRIRSGRSTPAALDAWDAELARWGIALRDDRAAAVERVAAGFPQQAAD